MEAGARALMLDFGLWILNYSTNIISIMNLDNCKFQRALLFIGMFAGIACELNAKNFYRTVQSDTSVYVVVNFYPKLITSKEKYKIGELSKFINEHLQWPRTNLDCEGRVYISFIIEKDGSLSNKKFAKRLCDEFDEEAMKVIDLMKVWQPGKINKRPVRTLVTIPVTFNLKL
jgi:TonB family protein